MNKDIVDILMLIAAIVVMFMLCYSLENTRKERDKYYKAACILSDCCRNMKDAYGDNDSICIYYNNIAIEEGVDNIFTNYYFCY